MNARTHFVCTVEGCAEPHDAKGFCREHYKRWKRHGDPTVHKQAPRGSGWLQRGYRIHQNANDRKREHVMVAERALGKPLPPKAVVHHMDEDRTNNGPGNLVICADERYHNLLHIRMRSYAATGHWDRRKCPYCGTYDEPANMRGEQCGRFVHRECSTRARRAAYAKRKAA